MTNRKSEKINRQKCFSAKMKIGNFVKFGFVSILLFVWFGCCCRRDLFAVYTQKVRSKIVRVHAHCIHSFSQTFRKEFLHRRLLVNRNLYHFRLVWCIAHCVRLERILFVSSFSFGSSSSTFVFILSASSLPSSSPRMFAIMEFCRSFQFSFFLCFAKNKTSTSGRTETNKYRKPNDERREKKKQRNDCRQQRTRVRLSLGYSRYVRMSAVVRLSLNVQIVRRKPNSAFALNSFGNGQFECGNSKCCEQFNRSELRCCRSLRN